MKIDEIIKDVRAANRVVEPALAVIAIAQKALGTGGLTAARVIEIIREALHTFGDVADGRATSDQASESLAGMLGQLDERNARADAALAARFPEDK